MWVLIFLWRCSLLVWGRHEQMVILSAWQRHLYIRNSLRSWHSSSIFTLSMEQRKVSLFVYLIFSLRFWAPPLAVNKKKLRKRQFLTLSGNIKSEACECCGVGGGGERVCSELWTLVGPSWTNVDPECMAVLRNRVILALPGSINNWAVCVLCSVRVSECIVNSSAAVMVKYWLGVAASP